MSTAVETPRDLAQIEAEIARTRASLNRKIEELERRLSPSHKIAEVKQRLDLRQLDPRPYPHWLAAGAVALGAVLAITGWRKYRRVEHLEADLDDVVIFEVCEDDTLLGDDTPA